MVRIYTSPFSQQSFTTTADLVSLKLNVPTGVFVPRRIVVADTDLTLPNPQQISLACFAITSMTFGSGGVVITPSPADQGDTPSKCNCHIADAAGLATGGSSTMIWSGACNVYQGVDSLLAGPPVFSGVLGFVFRLIQAPSVALALSGFVEWEELGA